MLVYVQNKDGKPLMPTSRCGKVRRLLKAGKAVVVEQIPFTIRLCYDTTDYVQPITLGVDAGTKHVGLSATTERMELYASEITLRDDIVGLIASRSKLRSTRRKNSLRFRCKKFLNKRKGKGWVAPSVKECINSHLRNIAFVCRILPVCDIIIEVAQFDLQKIKNPDISGNEYKNGDQFGFYNVREYVLSRDKYKCMYCGCKQKDTVLNVHHIESRKTGGDSPGNLITLCKDCHKKCHSGEIDINIKRSKSLRNASTMNIMRWKLYDELKSIYGNVYTTFGYITKYNRVNFNIIKTHVSDAFIVSKNLKASQLDYYYVVRLTRRHNRKIHKSTIYKGGKRRNNQASFEVMGFRLFDRVLFNGDIMFITARRVRGTMVIRDINYENKKEHSFKKLKLYRHKRNMIQLLHK